MEQTKRCTKCGLVKPLNEFHNCKSFKDGKTYVCKSCAKERKRNRYLETRETTLAKCREYAIEHAVEISEYHKTYREENHEKIISHGYEYREANRESTSAKSKEERRTKPEIHIFRGAKKRAKEKGLPFLIEQSDILVPDFCPILGIPLAVADGKFNDNSPTLDRLIPELGYVPGNIAVISNRANRMKDNATSEEHRLLADWIEGKSKIQPTLTLADQKHAGTLITCAKSRAKKSNVPINLQKKDIFIPDVCPALGIPIVRNKGHMQSNSPTLDKIIPELGYVLGNVAIISLKANRMKSNGTSSEHRLIADWMDAQTANLELIAA
jgi:hypothetical protein